MRSRATASKIKPPLRNTSSDEIEAARKIKKENVARKLAQNRCTWVRWQSLTDNKETAFLIVAELKSDGMEIIECDGAFRLYDLTAKLREMRGRYVGGAKNCGDR